MKPRICICCGEPMAQGGHGLSRDANLCASCSSMADGMLEDSSSDTPQHGGPLFRPSLACDDELLAIQNALSSPEESIPAETPVLSEEIVVEWKSGRLRKRE